ncbi:hypothetical protein EVAR_53630_1 [Eumeta japonica]|uniref:Uncharacterized protein n=1 Tax=Eumeta variegata TaxID=151549 RepID=A0A4C1WYB4_EUMVA|nr:hypothetical protein EVAR_53630_1 [Eumeta japonica]
MHRRRLGFRGRPAGGGRPIIIMSPNEVVVMAGGFFSRATEQSCMIRALNANRLYNSESAANAFIIDTPFELLASEHRFPLWACYPSVLRGWLSITLTSRRSETQLREVQFGTLNVCGDMDDKIDDVCELMKDKRNFMRECDSKKRQWWGHQMRILRDILVWC